MRSEQLGLVVVVRWEGERYRVRLYDPESGRYLPTLEEEAQRAVQEAQRAQEEARRAQEVEARARKLEEELKRLRGDHTA